MVKSISSRDLGWLEGIIDGEGSIYFGKSRAAGITASRGFAWQARLSVDSTDESIVTRVKKIIGEGAVFSYLPHKSSLGKKRQYKFMLANAGIRRLFPKLRLTAKERRRQLVLEAVNLLARHRRGRTPHDARLEQIWGEMRRLNA